jgi:hypothetical protein
MKKQIYQIEADGVIRQSSFKMCLCAGHAFNF